MKKYIIKILALVMCSVLLLGVFAGCNKDSSTNTPTPNNGYTAAEVHGTILLNVNACVNISFDKEGHVVNIQEVDQDGHEILADYAGYLGSSCAEVIKELVEISYNLELLNSEFNHIVIKQLPGAKLPSETFLNDLATAAKEAAEIAVSVTVITEAELDAEGNISAKKAYELLENALNVENFELIVSNEEIVEGVYAFQVEAGTMIGDYLVDAATGYVYEGTIEGALPEGEETEPFETPEGEVTQPVATEETIPENTEHVPEPSVEA